ncbi:MAG: hypothetical protein WCG34_06255 [Leptolinea sp.]
MNSDNKSNIEPSVSKMLDPYSNPRTIPAGWDVSAFSATENENGEANSVAPHQSKLTEVTTGTNEPTKDTL